LSNKLISELKIEAKSDFVNSLGKKEENEPLPRIQSSSLPFPV
jgi:hypothetical protein